MARTLLAQQRKSRDWLVILSCPIVHQGIRWKLHRNTAPTLEDCGKPRLKALQHLRRIVGETKLTYEELATTLAQIRDH